MRPTARSRNLAPVRRHGGKRSLSFARLASTLASAHAAFWVLFVLALALGVGALWTTRWLPFGDVNGWIELIDVVARIDDSTTDYARTYALSSGIVPNALVVQVGGVLARWMTADDAAKVMLSFYLAATPLAVLGVARTFGRTHWLALFACPMCFNALLNIGLLNFLVSLPFALASLPLTARVLARPRGAAGVGLAACLLLAFWAHLLGCLLGLGLSLVYSASVGRRGRSWRVLLAYATVGVPLVAWGARKYLFAEATEAGRAMAGAGGVGLVFVDGWAKLTGLHHFGLRLFRDRTDEAAAVLLGVSWLVLMLQGRTGVRGHHERVLSRAIALAGLSYLLLPSQLREVQLLAERFWVPCLLLMTAWPRVRRGRPTLPWAIVAVVAVLYPLRVGAGLARFEREYVGSLAEALAILPARARVAYVLEEREIDLWHMGPLWHLPKAIVAVQNGGVTDDSFAIRPHCPVQFREGRTPVPLGPGFLVSPRLRDWDYVLLRTQKAPRAALGSPRLRLRFHERGWYLFSVVR